ncbi:MAG TPA: GNAT family N-acetyltransferase [Casimicrobiaceae bacterium]
MSSLDSFDLKRIEEAGLNALQTQRQLFYDGWLLRISPGKAKRARSVNAHFGSTLPLAEKIAHCEKIYAQHGLAPLFRMTPFNQPADLEDALAVRGYIAFEPTLVQALTLASAPDVPAHDDAVTVTAPDARTFVDAAGDLRGSAPQQRDAHHERLSNSPLGKRFVAVHVGGRIVCTAQVAVDGALAGLFDVVTAEDARGRGYATLACASLLSWAWQHGAQAAYLQVSADNTPALAIYRKFGFATVYAYHYRGREGECE